MSEFCLMGQTVPVTELPALNPGVPFFAWSTGLYVPVGMPMEHSDVTVAHDVFHPIDDTTVRMDFGGLDGKAFQPFGVITLRDVAQGQPDSGLDEDICTGTVAAIDLHHERPGVWGVQLLGEPLIRRDVLLFRLMVSRLAKAATDKATIKATDKVASC